MRSVKHLYERMEPYERESRCEPALRLCVVREENGTCVAGKHRYRVAGVSLL